MQPGHIGLQPGHMGLQLLAELRGYVDLLQPRGVAAGVCRESTQRLP